MDSVGVNVIETAALGRPFQLGMLYDCRKDALVPGITLWDKEQLQQSIRDRPQIKTVFNVTASDSIEDKSNLLNIDGCLKLSLLSGLINVSGAAKYLSDTKKSFKQQRLTLHYHSTTKFEELTMNHLASGNIAHYEVFDNDTATHVVTAVLYGADACFVFDREVASDEDKSTVKGELKAVFDKLKAISVGAQLDLSLNDKQKTAIQKFSCKFYGDFQLQSNPDSFEDALNVFADLPKLLGEKKELEVPLRVWLYPLDKLHSRAAKLQKDISLGLIKNVESVFETLSITEMKCSDLLKDTPSLAFAEFCDKIMHMKQNCSNYKLSFMKKVGSLIPKIRGDIEKETALTELLLEHEECPFRGSDLEQWVKEKEKDSVIIKTLLNQLIDFGATVEGKLDQILMDLKVKNVVSYTFTSFEWPDVLLSKQKAFLSLSTKGNKDESDSKQNTGFTSDIKMTMRSNLTIFKNLTESKTCEQAKFIVTSKEMKNNPGSCILLYENGSDEASCFTPPSEPACPVIEQISGHSVVLKVPPACPATEELRLLYKMKEEKNWKSQSVLQSHDTVTLTDLSPDTEYEMKYAAVGKLKYTIHSDVIHLRVIDKKLIDATESVLETLSLIENKCSELMENNSAVTFSAILRKIQDMMKYCQTYEQDLHKRIKSMIQSIQACEKDISALTDLLQAHEESPFNKSDLTEWFTVKEKELKAVDVFLQQLRDSGAEVNNNLDSFLLDTSIKNLVCYTFSSLDLPDDLLSDQENFLNPQMMKRNSEKKPNAGSQTWLTGSIRETMKKHLKIFKDLILSNGDQTTVFLVTSKEHTIHPGSCILLYENGSDEASCFTPPSEQACPVIEQISGHSVVLKVPPACPATEELRLLYKMKEEKDWKSQSVLQSHDTVTLTDLSPDTEYEMKYAAVGKLKYTIHSDVIHLRVIDKKLINATESVLETISLIENKCSELMNHNSAVTFSAILRKIQDMMKYCQTYKQDLHNRIKSMIQSIQACEKDISALTDLLQAHEESPFNKSDLTEWLTVKEKELKAVDVFLQQLRDSGAEVNNNLDSFLLEISIKNLVCYTFSSLDLPDDLLSDQEHFLNPQMMKRNSEKKPNRGSQTWLTGSIRETMKKHLKIFKELILSNGDQTTVFLVTSKEHTIHPGSCILRYENGFDEASCFTPPSEQACPVIEQISGHSVVLKVPPACPATEELRLLYKMKEEKDWKSQSVLQSHDTVTLTDLSPDTEYEMKYAAVGKLKYTIHSDVIHLRVIDKKLINATESVLETLSLIENKCSELMENNSAVTFSAIHRKIQDMMKYCQTYKQDLHNRIKSMIQSIQACEKDISALTDLLQAHEKSPFNKSDLTKWLTVKEKELKAVDVFLQQLRDSGAEVNNNLDSFLLEISIKNLVCYTFSSLDLPDDLLSDQENFLNPQMMKRNSEKKPNAGSQTWLTGSIRETMKKHLKIFTELILSNGDQTTVFLVTSKEHTIHPGSCILLCENGSDEASCFTPPSEPTCPVIEQISGHSVVLKVPPACPATEELRLLYKMKEEKDWKSQSVLQSHDTVTLTDLSPDTKYEMKYAAVGKLKYTIHSDVIHLRVIDKKLINATESVLETLSLIENKCSELMNHNSAVTFSAIHRKIQDMMKYCQTYEQDLHNRIKSMIQSIQACEKDISALTDLLQAHEESPFNKSDLTEWLTVKEKELKEVDVILQQLRDSGAEVNNNLDSFLLDTSIKNLVCYTFSSLDLPDDLLSDQENFLNPQMMKRNSEKKPNAESQTWLTGSIWETMKKNLKIFKELRLSNGDQTTVFLIASKAHTIHPGSCILLYENGSAEASCFTPPSEQACPVIEQISGHSVVLKVSPACPGTEELRLLYKMKEEKDWKSQSVLQSHDTVTLTDLSPDTEYEMKYAAMGKLKYTIHSDVIHLRVIDKKLIDAKESVLETLSLIENKCSELMENNSAVTFSAIHRKIQDMMKYCQTYKQDLHNRIKSMIQSIQACEKDISALTDLLQAHEESPFNKSDLTEWLTVKEKELKEVDVILQQLRDSGAEVNNNLDSFLLDTSIKNLVCYTFSSLDLPDDLLSDQENFLNPQMMKRNSEKKPNAGSQTWLTGSIRETMKKHLKIFTELILSNGDQTTVFLVTSKEHTIHPGSCILLYENGSDEASCFTPPSEPTCPVIEQISGHSVVLKVPPACPATEELRLLYKMKEEKDWKSQSVLQSHDTVTLTDLSPDTEYEMKYAAVGKLKYTIHSDVIHLRVIDKKLINATESVLETLSLIENKCSELMNHNSAVTFSAIHRKIQDMMKYCQTYEQDLHNRIKSMIQSIQACEKDISALTDLLQAHEESPFNKSDLTEWLTVKEKELKEVDVILQQLRDSGAEVNNNLDSFLLDTSIKNLVCYTFSSLDLPDDLLSDQENFLNPQMMKRNSEKKPNAESQTWLTGSIWETMKKNLKIFKELRLSNGDQTTVFLIASKAHTIHPGSCILLYENGSDEASCFTPPSEQACPVIEQISGHSVVLKVSPACPGTEELRLLYKMKEEKDWKSQSVLQSHDTVTLTDLSPDTEYEMKYAAMGKLKYTIHSDVIHLRVIDKKLINATESVLETLSLIENKCSELMNHNSAVTFSAIHRKIQDMMKYCQTYEQDLHNRIKSMIQSIQACEKDISALTDLLQAHEESPFNKSDLTEWLTVKEKELKEVDVILQQLRDSGAEVNNNLDSFLLDTSIKNLVCYTFSSLDLPDDLLSDQEHFLNPQMMKRNSEKKPNAGSQTWLTGSIRETMKKHLKIFKELRLSNGDQTTVFLVTSKAHTIHPGSCILLYENGFDEASCFTPPSEQACPVIGQISGHSVVLKVPPACPATEELRLLYKMKEEKDWKSQSVLQSHDTVTLTDLSPDTEYKMKYAAVGKLKYTIHSDVIHLRVIDKKLIDAKESVLETLSLIENKCSELMNHNSAVTFSAIHRKIQDMMKYCQTYKQDLHNRIKSMIQSIQACEKDISALTDLLQAHEESPFNKSDLKEWLTVKEKELKEVDVILQQLRDSGAEVNNNLDTFLLDTSIKNLVCYTFSSLDLPDDLLSDQEHFLNPQMMKRNSEKKPNAGSQTWLTGSIRETMKKHLKIFKELILSNGDQTTVFLIASKEHTIHPGSCILLYENGSDEASCFTPPSEPACPVIEQISGHSVVLKVSPACPATEELRLLYKMKEEKDWKSQSVLQSHDTVTLTDLSPDTEYEMKYAAVGKLNYTVHSDVIRVTTHTTNIREESTRSKIFNKGVNIFSILTGKTANSHKHIISTLQYRIEDMREVGTVDESDIILVFCPVVSRAGTDIDQALDIFNHNTGSKLAVLVVLHHTFDKEKMVPDSSRCVNRTDILTVDCLFYEDTGLLKCQKNSDAVDKVVNWLRQQRRQTGVKIRLHQNFTNPGQNRDQERKRLAKVNKRQQMGNNEPSTKKVKVFSILAGKIKNCHKEFFDILRNRIENLEEARTVDESDIILVFCSIVSRAGTDIDAALKNSVYPTDKLAVLVVLHHTFDPEKTVPDSSRCVNRTDILTVDCLFCEDTGLLKCQKNSDAYDKTVYWLIQQGAKIGITISPCQNKSSSFTDVFSSFLPLRGRWE